MRTTLFVLLTLVLLTEYGRGQSDPNVPQEGATGSVWQVKEVKVELQDRYEDREFGLVLDPSKPGDRLTVIRVVFRTDVAESPEERKQNGNRVTEEGMDFLLGKGKMADYAASLGGDSTRQVLAKPSRLLVSWQVVLELPDGSRLSPLGTSTPVEGLKYTPRNSSDTYGFASDKAVGGTENAVPRFVRSSGGTVAIVQIKKEISLSFIYSIPTEANTAKFRFYDCEPWDIRFK